MTQVDSKAWRWTCPHCRGGPMALRSADRHLRRRHADCAGCRIERHMVQAMAEGRGFIVQGVLPFDQHVHAR
jgi:hypothetical protein